MVRIQLAIDLQYQVATPGADFIFNIHAAHTACQTVVQEDLQLHPALLPLVYTDPVSASRYLRVSAANGPLQVGYRATVDIRHHLVAPEQLPETPVVRLPVQTLPFIYPSRYCQSDRLAALAMAEFGHLPKGCSRVLAIQDWVRRQVTFKSSSSSSTTSALDTLLDRVGVCRDFAHLMIALCRALNIPARFVTGIDYGADPALGPTDFHAYVEVFLGDRWYIFDPSGTAIPMGFVRIGTGRDAADVSFATIFGVVSSSVPVLQVSALTDPAGPWEMPRPCSEALSTTTAQPV